MTDLTLIQPKNLGPQFYMRPDHTYGIAVESADLSNLVRTGSDGGAFLAAADVQGAQITYNAAIVGRTIVFYATANGVTSAVATLDLSVIDMTVTGATITNGMLTLTESNGGPTITVDLSAFIKSVVTTTTPSIKWTGSGTAADPLKADLVVDATVAMLGGVGNLLRVSATGVRVDPVDVLGFLSVVTTTRLQIDATNGLFKVSSIGSQGAIGIVRAVGLDGTVLGFMFAPGAAS